jgi:putative ABC transport system permease protein
VSAATIATYVSGTTPNASRTFIPGLAVEGKSFLEVFDEVSLTPDAKAAWLEDRQGVVIGELLARRLRVSVGERVTVETRAYGQMQFTVRGIYSTTRTTGEQSMMLLHWEYLNEFLPTRERDHVRWIFSRIRRASEAPAVGEALDRAFEHKETPTITMSEKAASLAVLAGVSSILASVDIASMVILLISMLILGNTIAMGVRERTIEYAILRALGFSSAHVGLLVLGEALTFGLITGGLGVAVSYPVVELGMGRWLEENMSELVPHFRISARTLIATPLIALAVGLIAATIPAIRAMRIPVLEGLRRVG